MKVLNSNRVRAELFKLFYKKNKFVLHEAADASEALDNILKALYAAFTTQGKIDNLDFDSYAELNCNSNCPVHRLFYQEQI